MLKGIFSTGVHKPIREIFHWLLSEYQLASLKNLLQKAESYNDLPRHMQRDDRKLDDESTKSRRELRAKSRTQCRG